MVYVIIISLPLVATIMITCTIQIAIFIVHQPEDPITKAMELVIYKGKKSKEYFFGRTPVNLG
jgi:hypothetical protein